MQEENSQEKKFSSYYCSTTWAITKRFLYLINNKLENWLLIGFIIFFSLIIIMEVFSRYLFSHSTDWAEELARYCLVYTAYIGGSLAVRTKKHIRIDLIFYYVGPRASRILELFADVCFIVFCAYIIIYSLQTIDYYNKYQTLSASMTLQRWGITLSFAYAALPIGWGLMGFRLIQRIFQTFAKQGG